MIYLATEKKSEEVLKLVKEHAKIETYISCDGDRLVMKLDCKKPFRLFRKLTFLDIKIWRWEITR